jgi:hypothetical protein
VTRESLVIKGREAVQASRDTTDFKVFLVSL